MCLHRLARHAQREAHFFVGAAIGDQAYDVGFAPRQDWRGRLDLPLKDEPARGSGSDGIDQLARLDALGHESGGA